MKNLESIARFHSGLVNQTVKRLAKIERELKAQETLMNNAYFEIRRYRQLINFLKWRGFDEVAEKDFS